MIWEQKVATVVMLTNLKERKEVSDLALFFSECVSALLLSYELQCLLLFEPVKGTSEKSELSVWINEASR